MQKFSIIHARYLLVTFIPFFTDDKGGIWLDEGWHRDLQRHTEYIKELTIIAPQRPHSVAIPKLLKLSLLDSGRINFVALKSQDSLLGAIWNLSHTVRTIGHEVRRSDVVHSSIVGWPFPLGWIANSLALFHKCKLILVVESAPWRNPKAGFKNRLMSWLTERLGRFFMCRADLAIATQPSYLATLRRPGSRGFEFVNPASWVNEDEVISSESLLISWENKRSLRPIKLIFAGRLTQDKGVETLLAAIDQLNAAGVPLHIDIIGEGQLLEVCKVRAGMAKHPLEVHVLNSVKYGADFFELLQGYHAVLVPSQGDEQPRILFDAFAQGVPVIASDTDGIKPHVNADNGWLFPIGDVNAMVATIISVSNSLDELERRGKAAHYSAQKRTHLEMHRARSHEIAKLFL